VKNLAEFEVVEAAILVPKRPPSHPCQLLSRQSSSTPRPTRSPNNALLGNIANIKSKSRDRRCRMNRRDGRSYCNF
jgi:hypothetical protein